MCVSEVELVCAPSPARSEAASLGHDIPHLTATILDFQHRHLRDLGDLDFAVGHSTIYQVVDNIRSGHLDIKGCNTFILALGCQDALRAIVSGCSF